VERVSMIHFNELADSVEIIKGELNPSLVMDLKEALKILSEHFNLAIDTFEAGLLINGHRHNVSLSVSLDLNITAADGRTIRLTDITKLKGS
jgi:hypothetical protein